MPDIDATPGGSTSNAYLDLDTAQELADERIGAAAWLGLVEDDQARTLITASRAIDALDLIGDPSSADQSLHFPVDGADVIPPKIAQATFELALSYAPFVATLAAGGTADDPVTAVPSLIKEEIVGPLTTVYFTPEERSKAHSETIWGLRDFPLALRDFPLNLQRLLKTFVRDATSTTWGSSAVVRGS